MADEADIARMEAQLARVAAVGPKWEAAIDKLRRQFPNDSYAVHQRVKSMVAESRRRKFSAEIARMEDEITRVAAVGPTWGNFIGGLRATHPNDTAAVYENVSIMIGMAEEMAKEIQMTLALTSPSSEANEVDTTLTLPVEEKALMDLSNEMARASFAEYTEHPATS